MSVTFAMKASRPAEPSERKVPPGMTSIQSVFQTERPIKRLSVATWLESKGSKPSV